MIPFQEWMAAEGVKQSQQMYDLLQHVRLEPGRLRI